MVSERVINLFKKTPSAVFLKNNIRSIFEEHFAPLFETEWGRRASLGALCLFSLFLAVTIIETFVTWHDDFVITHTHIIPTQDSSLENMSQAITEIPNEHLFGMLGKDQDALPITSLQLHLIGVIKSDADNLSRVIISEAGQPGKVYAVGDSLPSGIVVNAITDDGVILENGGRLEKLPLQRTPLAFQGMPKPLSVQEG